MSKETKVLLLTGRLAHLGARTHKENSNVKKKIMRQLKSLR